MNVVCVYERYVSYDKNHLNLKLILSLQNGFWSMCLNKNITFMLSLSFTDSVNIDIFIQLQKTWTLALNFQPCPVRVYAKKAICDTLDFGFSDEYL